MQVTLAPAPGKRGEEEQIPVRADGEPAYFLISASQLTTWWDCKRKWAWQYIDKIKVPSGKGAALGSRMHEDQLEPYLKTGRSLDFTQKFEGTYVAEVARAGLQYIPTHETPGLEVEKYFRFSVPEEPRIVFRGYKDYRIGPEHRADGLPHVGDHKSCGNWEYAKTADDLLGDTQAIIYAKDELLRYPSVPAVTLQWTYYGTKKPYKAKPVTLKATRAHVDYVFPEIVLGARELVTTLRSKADPLSLPPNAEICDKYGGCPFRAKCNLSPKERRPFMSNTSTATSNLLARIKARQEADAAKATPAATTAAPTLSPLQAKLAAAKAAAQAAPALSPVTVEQQINGLGADTEAPAPTDVSQTAFADPTPKAPTPPALPVTDQPINCPTDFQPPPASDAEREAAEAAALASVKPAEPAPPPAEDKPKRGRPAGSKNKPKDGPMGAHSPTGDQGATGPNAGPVTTVTFTASAEAPSAEGRPVTLYINCLPTEQVIYVDTLIAIAKKEINESQNVGDYRFVEFGKGAGMLSARVAELAAERRYADLYLDTATPEGAIVKSALVSMAARVVQATR